MVEKEDKMSNTKWEPLGKNHKIKVSEKHNFNTDTILLANFSAPYKNDVCADFGTGCGTIAMIWSIRQNPKKIIAVELQHEAYDLAYTSFTANKLDNIEIVNEDIKKYKEIFESGSLSHIACNPPYKARGAGIKNTTDNLRIARHEDELSLEELAKAASYCLKFGGKFFICQRPERLSDAMCIFSKYGLEPKRLRLVQQRQSKAPFLFLLECRRGGKVGMTVMPTLFVEENGEFSKEMIDIYGDYKEGNT